MTQTGPPRTAIFYEGLECNRSRGLVSSRLVVHSTNGTLKVMLDFQEVIGRVTQRSGPGLVAIDGLPLARGVDVSEVFHAGKPGAANRD